MGGGEGGGGEVSRYDVLDFLCQKLESVCVSEIVFESIPNSDNSDYFLQKKKHVKRDTKR